MPLNREPAEDESCAGLVSAIVRESNAPRTRITDRIINFRGQDISLNSLLKKRKALRARYEKITESIRDFEIRSDAPIKGKTKLVLDAREGYLAKIMMIRNAKKTIDLSYYIFTNDDTAKALLHELRLAIKRGVKVRILVDSSGSITKAPFYNDIKALVALSGRPILDQDGVPTGEVAKAEAVLFNPLFNVRAHVSNWYRKVHNLFSSDENFKPAITFNINRRAHDKILMADAHSPEDAVAMIGGRNISDHYYAVGEGEANPVIDAEILIKGFAIQKDDGTIQNALEDHYNKIFYYLANKNFENFLFKTNRELVREEFKVMRTSARKLIKRDGILSEELKAMEENKYLETDFEDGMISILNEIQNLSRTKIFFSPRGPHNPKNGNSLMDKIYAELLKAKKSIDLVSPYFWISDEEVEHMVEWVKADPARKVRIFSNSITTTDSVVVQAMVDTTLNEKIIKRIRGTAFESQIEVYSYGKLDDEILGGTERYGFLHAKLAVVDGKSVTVSTSNLDPVSRHLNSEVGTTIEDLPKNSKNLAKMNQYINDLQKNSTLYGSTEWQEIRSHPKNRIVVILQAFVAKIIVKLNLVSIL